MMKYLVSAIAHIAIAISIASLTLFIIINSVTGCDVWGEPQCVTPSQLFNLTDH